MISKNKMFPPAQLIYNLYAHLVQCISAYVSEDIYVIAFLYFFVPVIYHHAPHLFLRIKWPFFKSSGLQDGVLTQMQI